MVVLEAHTQPKAVPFVPRVRLFSERMLIDRGSYYSSDFEEVDVPAMELGFLYGSTLILANDPLDAAFDGRGAPVDRDPAAENQTRYILESLGAVDLNCVDHIEPPPTSRAHYLVNIEEDVHTLCGFSAYIIPQLRTLGFEVEIDPSYRWQVVDGTSPWYAELKREEQTDWFNLELGVEIDGERFNLLPIILELLEGAVSLDSLIRKNRRCIALPLDDKRYLPIPPERLRILSEVLLELYNRGQGDTLRITPNQASSLEKLEQSLGLPSISKSFRKEMLRLEMNPPPSSEACESVSPPAAAVPPNALRATLRPYQAEGLGWMQHLRQKGMHGILADDMGLGKTLQTIAHLLAEHTSGRTNHPSLVVAPTSVVENWRRELRRFAPALWVLLLHGKDRHSCLGSLPQCDIALTSYALLIRDIDHFTNQQFHYVVLDEAQTIKNSFSHTHKAVRSLRARHRLCLTGTPLENHLGELWSLFDFLMPNFLGNKKHFSETYRHPIESAGNIHRLTALRNQVAPYILRRTKEEVAKELPPKTEIVRAVELHGLERELYESIRIAAHAQVRQAIVARGLARSTVTILDALMKLRQVCCDPRLVKVNAARRVKESSKFELLFELLPQQIEEGRRILLFSQFTSMLALIGDELRKRHLRYVSLTGSTVNRQAQIDAFNNHYADIFLISLKAGGTGLNLTTADTVIHYDPWWNPAAQAQATDRTHRIGQKRAVFVYNLIVAGSVEERMLQLQKRKKDLAQSILSAQGAVDFTEREIEDLFLPLSDE